MTSKVHALMGASLLALAVAGCGGGGSTGTPDLAVAGPPADLNLGTVSFSQIQTQVFIAKCGVMMRGGRNCHLVDPAEGSLNLTVGLAYNNLVNKNAYIAPTKLLVKPGDPANSFIMQKLNDMLGPTEGNPMPFQTGGKADPISQDLRNMVQQWIAEGAPQN